jgi:hypothetical protein
LRHGEVALHYEENMKMFGELRLLRALTDEQIAAMRDTGSPPPRNSPEGQPPGTRRAANWPILADSGRQISTSAPSSMT